MNYIVDDKFELSSLHDKGINLIVSNSALEHFDNVASVIQSLNQVVEEGTCFFSLIDMQTHTRWIREKDPNNIYRFPSWLYKRLKYPGIPNRLRMEQYEELMRLHGWKSVKVLPSRKINLSEQIHTIIGLSKEFIDNDMEILSCVVMAQK